MLIGYARVSTEDQNLDLQMHALNDAKCDRIFSEKRSSPKIRQGLEDALSHLRPGDTLVNFKSLTNQIDTTTSAGRFFFHIMASLAQMESELVSERTKAGLGAANRLGRVGGRPAAMTDRKIKTTWLLIWEFRMLRYTAGFQAQHLKSTGHRLAP